MKRLLLAVAFILPLVAVWMVQADAPATTEFDRTWARTDKPIADGQVSRTWNWAPEAFTGPIAELYDEAPGGQRTVQYFDKARMEDNTWRTIEPPWDVTTGLLATELMSGVQQVGDAHHIPSTPAQVNVGGDATDPNGPTYATFGMLRSQLAEPAGSVLSKRVNRAGNVSVDASLAAQGITVAVVDDVTNHGIATPFWDFMNSSGIVWNGDSFVSDQLFQNPYFATGRPVTEAYWAEILVGGAPKLVLIQCFERRCLTYTPSNAPEWRVEMGNIGRHYYEWRYSSSPPSPTATTPAQSTATSPSPPTATQPAPPPTNTSVSPPTATSTSISPPANCHPSYPDHCVPPPPPDLNCPDLPSAWKPIRVLHNVPNPDPHDFDRDSDGWGCESG